MARTINKLSPGFVNKTTKPGRYGDGGGLWLQVSQFGTKAWIFRFMLDGRARQMGLGSVDTFSLKEARERAREARQLVADGIDPIEARNQKKDATRSADAKRVTFWEAAERYIKAHKAGWKSAKHADQWKNTLATYAKPVIGDLPVAKVDTSHVMQILEKDQFWSEKTETASRVRGRIESVLDWAKARHYRSGENPARWKGHLDKLLPARAKVQKVRHQPAMAYADLPAFVESLRANDSMSARALEFTVLTAVRTGETIGAKWDEIDFDSGVWTIPGERMKAGQEHRVPLSDRAIEILKALPREDGNDHVFIGGRKGRGLSNMAMLELLRGHHDDLTVHGFRSSFRDWAAEATNYANHIVEKALAHTVADKVEAAYRRGDLFEKRRRLMRDWMRYCQSKPVTKADNVLPMRERA